MFFKLYLLQNLNYDEGLETIELERELDLYRRQLVDIDKLVQDRLTLETNNVNLQYQVHHLNVSIAHTPQYVIQLVM